MFRTDKDRADHAGKEHTHEPIGPAEKLITHRRLRAQAHLEEKKIKKSFPEDLITG